MTNFCPACLTDNSAHAVTCIACGYILSEQTNSNNSPSTSPLHLASGTVLKQNTYQIQKTLGEGGFGIVYQGINLKTLQEVAIKELLPERSSRQGNSIIWSSNIPPRERQDYLQKFLQEITYLSLCMPHPNIVPVYEGFEENNTAYVVMGLIKGKSLSQILKKEKRLPEQRVRTYFIKIAQALKIVHQNKFLHRDIKPDNILITDQDEPILIDFGNAREYLANKTHTVIATPEYAPLEQLTSNAQRSPSMDFFSVCATMYELVTGQLPTSATERVQQDLLPSPKTLIPSLSPQIEQVILTGLRLRAEDRFQTADELINALQGKFISPVLRRARQLIHEGNLSEAVQAYQTCLRNDPHLRDAAVELAMILLCLDENQAETIALQAIQLQGDSRGYGVLGLIHCRRGKWNEAKRYLETAVSLSPQESWIQANLAWAAGKCTDWQLAEKAAKRAIELNNQSPFAFGVQAWIAANQQHWKTAIASARPAIFKVKQHNNDLKLLSWLYPCLILSLEQAVITQQATDVERCLQEFLRQKPNNAWAWGFQAWRQAKQGLWQEALGSCEQASDDTELPSWKLINQAIIQEHLSNFPEAIQIYETCLQKFSLDAMVYFRLGTLLGRIGQYNQARTHLEKAVQLKSDYAEAYHNLGWVLLNLNNNDASSEYGRDILLAYRQAVKFYHQQEKKSFAHLIEQAFQVAGVVL